MNLACDASLGLHLRSRSQQVRVITENWFRAVGYCLACSSPRLEADRPNSAARDFTCPDCGQSYELKSSKSVAKKRVVDGAYGTMLARIASRDAPALVLLQYVFSSGLAGEMWSVRRLVAIHPVFLTTSIVEPRKPLSASARRSGWQGCNLRIDRIPPEGKITLIEDGISVSPSTVRRIYNHSRRLSDIDPQARGWTALVLNIIRRVGALNFCLSDIYEQLDVFQEAFPDNQNVKAKIRQQLQVLRDLGYIKFLGHGNYRVIND